MRVEGEDAKDPGNAQDWKKHSHCLCGEPEMKCILDTMSKRQPCLISVFGKKVYEKHHT